MYSTIVKCGRKVLGWLPGDDKQFITIHPGAAVQIFIYLQ